MEINKKVGLRISTIIGAYATTIKIPKKMQAHGLLKLIGADSIREYDPYSEMVNYSDTWRKDGKIKGQGDYISGYYTISTKDIEKTLSLIDRYNKKQ